MNESFYVDQIVLHMNQNAELLRDTNKHEIVRNCQFFDSVFQGILVLMSNTL